MPGERSRGSRARRLLKVVLTPPLRLGLGPRNTYLLTVPGRRTGRLYTTPVTLVEQAGRPWLVAPFGEREWVKNARAAGAVELRRGRTSLRCAVAEVSPAERAPILRTYLERVPIVRPFFDARKGAPVEAFAAEAERHPVFRLEPPPRLG